MSATLRPMGPTTAVQRRDRPWLKAYVGAIIGPFAMPSLGQVRDAVTTLTDTYPHSRLNWGVDATGRYWHAGRSAESIVTEGNWRNGSTTGETLDAIVQNESLEPPLSLIRFPNHLALRMSHGVGDGRIFNTILAAVVQTAMTAEVPPWPAKPTGRSPLAAAVCRTFGRHPSLIRAAVNDRHPKERDHHPEAALPWTPSRRTISAPIPHSELDELSCLAQTSAHSTNLYAVQICLTLRALRAVGLKVSRDVNVVVDLRRYLGWRFIDGNFLAGVPMRIGPETTPEQISATMRATVRSGRPLASQVLSSLRGDRAGTAADDSVDATGPLQVTFSGLAAPEFDPLPFLPGRQVVAAGSVEPGCPRGVTFLNVQTSSVTWTNASFHDNVIDAALVDQALKLVVADPIRLLSEPIGTS